MIRFKRTALLFVVVAALGLLSLSAPSHAGLGDKLKKKVKDKAVDTATDKAAQKAADKADAVGEKLDAPDGAAPGQEGDGTPGSSPPPTEVSKVSTKFDFMPGDKVLLYDDFTQDDLGEFPSHWKLVQGTVETAEMDGERWCRLAGDYGRIRPKVPGLTGLPEYWTLEFDIYSEPPYQWAFVVSGMAGNQPAWNATFLQYGGTTVTFQSGPIQAQTVFELAPDMGGRHHVSILARGAALKVYVDTQRMLNIPEVTAEYGAIGEIQIDMSAPAMNPMITNVRFAEGPVPTKDPFADGTLVSYGIYFDSGSDVVKAESAPVLRQIAAYMEKNAAVKVKIVGHTDNQGSADGNLDLSKRRAASVAAVLAEQFKVAADRFETDGMGDIKAVASNADAEGRAMNRRVEFSKL
jgi:outer membrane protein OmpA-like peptidoglycan-associated protein